MNIIKKKKHRKQSNNSYVRWYVPDTLYTLGTLSEIAFYIRIIT